MTLARFSIWHIVSMIVFVIGLWMLSAHDASAALTQNDYRFYVNTNAQTPTDPWPSGGTDLGENTAATGVNGLQTGDVARIRMNLTATTAAESALTFKLQYKAGATCSTGTYSDVGASGSATIWRGFINSSVTDGGTLTSNLLGASDVSETYEEANNSAVMPNAINVGQDGEWDWVIQNNGANPGTTYCFRMVKSDGTALTTYSTYPTLAARRFNPRTRNWRWYDDQSSETPLISLAQENFQPFGQTIEDPIKLRLTISDAGNLEAVNQKFSLQFSTSSTFASGVTAVTEAGSCTSSSLWCYADGVDADDDAITTRVLTDSVVSGVHNESGTSSSAFDHPALAVVEYEFTVKSRAGVSANTVYYFRAYDNNRSLAVVLATGASYPSIKTRQTTLSFTLQGLDSGATVDTFTTNITTTTTTIPFGTLVPNSAKTGAQRLTVTQDGEGYIVYLKSDGQLRTGSVEIDPVSGTNSAPSVWGMNVNAQTSVTGAFGYHTDDNVLSGSSTRFQNNDTWAQVETTRMEIVSSEGPLENDIHDILFRVMVSPLQPQGAYTAVIQYIVVPTF